MSMQKRGSSHIEMVIAFILYITTISLAIYLFNPTPIAKKPDFSAQDVEGALFAQAGIPVTTYEVMINNTNGQITSPQILIDLNADQIGQERVVNASGAVLNSSMQAHSQVSVAWDKDNGTLLYLSFGEDFQSPGLIKDSTVTVNENFTYILGKTTLLYISENKMLASNNSYYNDYIGFKHSLHLSDFVDFGFTLYPSYTEGIIYANRSVPNGISVSSESKVMPIQRSNGTLTYGGWEVKIW